MSYVAVDDMNLNALGMHYVQTYHKLTAELADECIRVLEQEEGWDSQKVFGDRAGIDLESSDFRQIIESGNLYVDKTRFIEHVLDEASSVLLITRPRKSGKSLNLDMLRTFLDTKQDSKDLFKGLRIESSPVFERINSAPVIYLSFKEMRADNYKEKLKETLMDTAHYYLSDNQFSRHLLRYIDDDGGAFSSTALRDLIVHIHEALGREI